MKYALAATAALLAAPAFAGDAAVGEAEFKKCKSCHAIVADDGTEIQKGGKTGPNLYGVIGRQIGAGTDFKYGEDLVAAGADGAVWDEASLAAYVTDPGAWLKEKTGNAGAKSKMTFKLKSKQEDVAAYLASVKQ
jgi:cytochrome c